MTNFKTSLTISTVLKMEQKLLKEITNCPWKITNKPILTNKASSVLANLTTRFN